MTSTLDEATIRAALGPARALEPSEAEVHSVVARTTAPSRRRASAPRWAQVRRLAPVGLVALTVLAGGAYAVPPLRAALDGVADNFAGWVQGDSTQAPGRPAGPGDQVPRYMHPDGRVSDPRVIAQAGGYKLYVALEPGGYLGFDLGNTGAGLGYPPETLRQEFSRHAVFVLGPGGMERRDKHGHVPLFGLIAPSVASVELTYASGPPLRLAGIEDGFVFLAEPERRPRELVAFDSAGKELERVSTAYIHWEDYLPGSDR